MAICETCGHKYAPTAAAPDCPHCAAGTGARRPATARAGARPTARARAAAPVAADEPAPRRGHVAGEPEVLDQSSKIGLMATGGLALIVLVVVVMVMRSHAADKEREDKYQADVKALVEKFKGYNVDNESQAKALVKEAAENEKMWRDHASARDITLMVSRAKASLEAGQDRRESLKQFDEIETALTDPSKLTPEKLDEMRRRLTELEAKITIEGGDALTRYTKARATIDRTFAESLLASVTGVADTNNPRPGLTAAYKAEDELRKLLEEAKLAKNAELQTFYTEVYKNTLAASDKLATALLSTIKSDTLPVIDCLSGDQANNWNPSEAKGFTHEVKSGVLTIVGPNADAGRMAIMSIGDREQWRNLLLEFEFTLEQGSFDLYFRLGKSPNPNTIVYTIKGDGENPDVKLGRKYKATARLLGSQFIVRFDTEDLDTPQPEEKTVSWTMLRKGAIGILIPPTTRLTFSSFKVREIR